MQDPLENYLNTARNVKQDEPLKISKEMMATAQLKKECDTRAMKIIQFSIEGKLKPEVFTRCLPFINQAHYQDIVEERAITKLCGYSLCGKRISEMPQKQYFISTKSNKVYDITDRKNFCSNFCYKASIHIKKQIDNSPLWLRKLDDIPEYKLLPSSDGGLPGDVIDQGVVKPVQCELNFTSVTSFAEASLGDIKKKGPESGKNKGKTSGFKKSSRLKSTMQTIKETEVEEEITVENMSKTEKTQTQKRSVKSNKMNCRVSLPSIKENEEVLPPMESSIKHQAKRKPAGGFKSFDIEGVIRNAVEDWITLETCMFVHGEAKVRSVLNEKKMENYFEDLHVQELQREQQMKYMEICRRLQFREMADDKFDKAIVEGHKLKPLPDFKQLKEDTKDMKIKVRSFYDGTMYEQTDNNFTSQTKKSIQNADVEEGPPAVLPPVDANSQKLMRRKIFLTSASKAVQQLLQILGAPTYTPILAELQALARTFTLKANNITFKPLVWNYIAVVLLDLLSIKDKDLREVLEECRSQEYIRMLFEGLPSKKNFVPSVLNNVINVDLFVERYITKNS